MLRKKPISRAPVFTYPRMILSFWDNWRSIWRLELIVYAFLKLGVTVMMLGIAGRVAPGRKLKTFGKEGAPGVEGENVSVKARVDPSFTNELYQRFVGGAS